MAPENAFFRAGLSMHRVATPEASSSRSRRDPFESTSYWASWARMCSSAGSSHCLVLPDMVRTGSRCLLLQCKCLALATRETTMEGWAETAALLNEESRRLMRRSKVEPDSNQDNAETILASRTSGRGEETGKDRS